MAAFLSTVIAGSALLSSVNAQNFGGSGGDDGGFSWVQPMKPRIDSSTYMINQLRLKSVSMFRRLLFDMP